jgi:ADP-ribose pyrophosphatase YjhB (NUDIX family)
MPVPEFIVSLRERIGHDLLWLPGVTAVVLRGADVLLVRRSDNGQWSPVTGIVEPGEHPATCAVREVLEETAVHAEVDDLVWVNVTAPVVHANGDRAQYLDHTFRCRYVGGEARVGDDESTEVGWFPTDALPRMSPGLEERIRTALRPGEGTRLLL